MRKRRLSRDKLLAFGALMSVGDDFPGRAGLNISVTSCLTDRVAWHFS